MLRKFLKQRNLQKLIPSKAGSPEHKAVKADLNKDISANLNKIKIAFRDSTDLKIRSIELDEKKAAIVYIDVLVNKEQVQDLVLRALMTAAATRPEVFRLGLEEAAAHILPMGEVKVSQSLAEVLDGLVNGMMIWLLEGHREVLIINVKGFVKRDVGTSETESVIRGSREGFIESLIDNIGMLRRRLRVPELVMERFQLGAYSQTAVCVTYLKGICREDLLAEVRLRLQSIQIDAILESNYIEEFIQDLPYTPFPLVGNVEKPDTMAAKLLEGRVGIIVDGTPIALTVPKLFVECFQTPDDYYIQHYYATFLRWLRYLSFFISITLPAFFVAIMNYHQEMIPTPLLITVAASREGTPFPAVVEIIVMLLIIYIVIEATARMPKVLGQTVSIVGTLVIGQAAISAGLVGAPVVIVVTVAALTAFPVLPLLAAGTVIRFCLLLGAAFIGLYGMVMVGIVFMLHLCSLESFKTPYLFPITPVSTRGLKDTLIRAPWPLLRTRPWTLAPDDTSRQPDASKGSFQGKRGRQY